MKKTFYLVMEDNSDSCSVEQPQPTRLLEDGTLGDETPATLFIDEAKAPDAIEKTKKKIRKNNETGVVMTQKLKWQICCCNEWCEGPEIFTIVDKKPITPIPCPTCGWLTLPEDKASMRSFAVEKTKKENK